MIRRSGLLERPIHAEIMHAPAERCVTLRSTPKVVIPALGMIADAALAEVLHDAAGTQDAVEEGMGVEEILLQDVSQQFTMFDAGAVMPSCIHGEASAMIQESLNSMKAGQSLPSFLFRLVHNKPSLIKLPAGLQLGKPMFSEISITIHKITGLDHSTRAATVALDPVMPSNTKAP